MNDISYEHPKPVTLITAESNMWKELNERVRILEEENKKNFWKGA